MRNYILSALAALAVSIVFSPAVLAQEGVPSGSYQQTCRDIRNNGDTLSARCQRVDGGWNDTSIDYRNCRGEIANDNGNLRCAGSGYQDRGNDRGDRGYNDRDRDRDRDNGLPPGDYKLTCRNMHVDGDRLYGSCEKRDGDWRDTSLKHFDRCQSPIVNDNGRLRCTGSR